MDHVANVRRFIVDTFLFGDDNGLAEDTSFLESGIIDSVGILELISFLEETYAICIEDHEIIPEHLDSLKNIAHFLEAKTTTPAQAGNRTPLGAAIR